MGGSGGRRAAGQRRRACSRGCASNQTAVSHLPCILSTHRTTARPAGLATKQRREREQDRSGWGTHLPYATRVRASSGSEMRAAVAWCSRYAWRDSKMAAARQRGWEAGSAAALPAWRARAAHAARRHRLLANQAPNEASQQGQSCAIMQAPPASPTRISGSIDSRLAALLAGAWCPCCFGSLSSCSAAVCRRGQQGRQSCASWNTPLIQSSKPDPSEKQHQAQAAASCKAAPAAAPPAPPRRRSAPAGWPAAGPPAALRLAAHLGGSAPAVGRRAKEPGLQAVNPRTAGASAGGAATRSLHPAAAQIRSAAHIGAEGKHSGVGPAEHPEEREKEDGEDRDGGCESPR